MRRRMVLVGVLAMTLAACGGSSGSPSPSASDAGSSAAASGSPSALPGSSPSSSAGANAASPSAVAPAAGTSTAVCDGISLRKSPASTAAKVKAINSGTSVHVAARVTGTAYTVGACGTSGSEWLKIDKVGGKTAKSLYGVTYVYAAAGFFQ
jgi:hypothetical protein